MKLLHCKCEGWVKHWFEIEQYFILGAFHDMVYTGRTFSHCPWCGRKLEEMDESKLDK